MLAENYRTNDSVGDDGDRNMASRKPAVNGNKKGTRESWIVLSILGSCVLFAGLYMTEIFHWMNRAQVTFMIAAPVADFAPVKRASLNYHGLLFPGHRPQDNEVHLESFDYVWNKIRESYWEEDFGGVDWEAAKQELRPQVTKAKNIKEVRQILNQLISRLGKSHFAIIPGSAYEKTVVSRKGTADAGIDFRYGDGVVLVSAVRGDSDAARQGVRPGWQITSVGELTVREFLEKAESYEGVVRLETLVAMSFGNLTSGKPGDELTCEFRLPDGPERKVTVKLSEPPGQFVQFGNLPPMRIAMEKKLLGSNVGYFRFNGFFDPIRLMPEFRKAVQEFQSADGLIIDIRGNGGGMVGMTMGMASPLTRNPAPLGVMKMKDAELKLALFKNPRPYEKKIAVLVDEASASASEIYAGGLQDLKIARIFGRRTAGLSLPSTVERLPNGDGFQYAFANYTSASGKVLEGNGVVPDETILLTPELLTAEVDPTLKQAVQWIHSDSGQKTDR